MAKTPNLNLELTTDETTLFKDWWKAMNGQGSGSSKSNMQLIDEAFGNIQASSNIVARAGEHIGDVGTPTVTVTKETDPQSGEPITVLTFNYLKGATGANGQNGQDGQDGQDGLTTKIEVNNVEYTQVGGKITLPDYPSPGTTVIANPTLVGTEANLVGLQVGQTKYKVPSGGGGSENPYIYSLSSYQIAEILKGKVLNFSKIKQFLQSLSLDISFATSVSIYSTAGNIFSIGQRVNSDSGLKTFDVSVLSLNADFSEGSNSYFYMDLSIDPDNVDEQECEAADGSSISELSFTGFNTITSIVTSGNESDFYPAYFEQNIIPIVFCSQYVNNSYTCMVKEFEWSEFFACFDDVNE